MRYKEVLEIWNSSERLLTDFYGLRVMLSMLLTVRDRPGCCLSTTVLSTLNLATIRRIQQGER